ncbi:MAG: hypothetical protein RIM33_07185 [Alphaproteobacteria bacterium]
MAKDKSAPDKPSGGLDANLRAPALALRLFEREISKLLEAGGSPLARQDQVQLSGIHSYTILLFMADYASADLSQKQFATLLGRHNVDTPGNLRIYPALSQSALFELFGNIGVSRETIRRLLILMSQHGLMDRVSKGPPFPDQLSLSKSGTKLMNRVAKKLAKELGKEKSFAYL